MYGQSLTELRLLANKYSVDALKMAIAQSSLNAEQIKAILTAKGLTDAEIQEVITTNALTASQTGATVSTFGLGTAFKGLGLSIKTATKAMIAWMASNPIGWITAVVSAIGASIYGVVKLHDALTVSLEEQKEKLQETKEAYESVKNELQEVETELQNTQNKVEELENTPNLSWVEQEELDRLREVTKELELQKQLKQDAQLESAEDLYKENEKTFDKEFKSSYGNTSIADMKEQLSSGQIGIGQLDYKSITDIVSALQHINEEKAKLTDESEIAEYEDFINDLTQLIKSEGQEYLSSLSEYKQNILEIASIRDLTEDEQDFYDYLSSIQKAIYEYYSPATWNSLEFDSVFDTEGIEKTKDELVSMYKSGELASAEMLEQFPKLNDAIRESEIIAGEGSDAYREFFNEIAALADETTNTVGTTPNISFNIDTYKDQIDKAQEEITKLADSLVKLESGDLSSSDLLDLIQEFPVLAEETDNLSGAIEDLAGDKLESLITSLQTAGASDELINLVRNMAAEAMNSASGIDSLNSSIDSLQSAYETLSDAVKEYNSTGTLSLDTLQTLLSLEPQYLNCLMTENGQLQLNTETLAMLTNKRLDDAEAQVVQNTIEQINTLTEQANAEAKDQNAISTDNARINTENYTMSLSDMATEAIVAAGAVSELNTALDGAKTAGVSQKDLDSVLGGMEVQLKAINSYRKNLSAGSVGSVLGSSKKSGSSKKEEDKWLEEYKKKLKELQNQFDKGLINEREFFLQSEILLNTYLKDSKEHMEKYADEISDAEKTLHSDLVNAYKYEADEYARLRDGNYLNMVEYYQSMMNLQDEYYNSEALKLKNLADTMEAQYGRMNHITLTRPSVDVSAIQEAGYATGLNASSVYAQSFGNETRQVIVTPVLPDGTILSPETLTDYADRLLKGEKIDADIELAVFDGEDAVKQAAEYVNGLENIQAEYIQLKNTLAESPYGDFTDEQLEALEQLTEEIEKHKSQLSSELGEIKSAYDSLIEIRDTYNKYGKISVNQYQSLCDMGFQYLALLSNENGALSLDENAFQRLTDAKIRQIQVDMALQATDLIKNIQTEEQAVQYLAASYDSLADSALGAAERMLYAAKANAELLYGVNSLQAQAAATIVKGYENSKLLSGITSDTGSGSGRSNVDLKMESGGGYKKESEEVIDFFEQRVKILDDALSRLKTNLDNVAGSFAKNNLIDAELGITEEKFKNYSDALNMYTQKADEALSKLPADIAEKVKDGAVDLTTFIGDGNKEVTEAVKDYEQWADKVADCKQELAELRTAIRQLELEKFNNIMEDFTNQFDLHGDGKDLISKQIDLLKEAGQLIGESFFTTQIDQSKKQLAILEDEKVQLVNQMSSAIGSGRVQKASDEWLSMVNSLTQVEGNILDCKKAIEEFDNELLQLHWDIFDRIQDQFNGFDSELSNLRGLFDDFKVTDDNFNWSKEGLAQLGLLTQQYELAQYQVQQYNDEINQLNSDYLAGRYSATEYADRLSDLSSAQWDAVNSSESIKDAIIDLNEVRINEEIDAIEKEISAYKELIDSQIKALQSEKDLHDYRKSIEETVKSKTDIERQLAAMANDDSLSAKAQKAKLKEELAKINSELEEKEYDHSIEAQENALNKQLEDYEAQRNAEIEALRASLEERETLISQSFENVKANADLVGQEIAYIATQHGITVSDALITSWQNGEHAIASYGEVLSAGTSAFIGNIMGVENEVYALQSQANATADTLAYMFATRADNLVNELTSAYYSEANVNAMTNALQDSLVNTLERGYNISSITSAMDSITACANNVASAADNAASALSRMGAAQSAAQSNVRNYASGVPYTSSQHQTAAKTPVTGDDLKYIYVKKDHNVSKKPNSSMKFYASGTRNAKGGLRVINEEGIELTLPKLSSGNYTIGNDGDQILTKDETDNVYEWAKIEPDKLMAQIAQANPTLWQQALTPFIPGSMKSTPEVVSSNTNNNINVHYDSLVNIQGSVIDGARVVKQIEDVATKISKKEIKQSWHDVNMTWKYHTY